MKRKGLWIAAILFLVVAGAGIWFVIDLYQTRTNRLEQEIAGMAVDLRVLACMT